jgi:hypothetical protein
LGSVFSRLAERAEEIGAFFVGISSGRFARRKWSDSRSRVSALLVQLPSMLTIQRNGMAPTNAPVMATTLTAILRRLPGNSGCMGDCD